jgi:uncharacterized protein
MVRKLTPRSSLENLKREAKRWLKALRENDVEARARLERVVPHAPPEPTLRDVQHALALEYGHVGWAALTTALERIDTVDDALAALLEASGRGNVARVAELLDAHPDIVSARGYLEGNFGKRTALHYASGGHGPVVALLLDRGADPNVRDDGDNAFPLHFAAEKERLDIIRLLIEHGADPIGTGDGHELEVIGWATVFGKARRDVVDYLLAHGARHNISSAVATGAVDDIAVIAAARPDDVNKPMDSTNHRRTPLHLAVVKKQVRSLVTLLELGANPNLVDAAGLTPLDQAALAGEQAMVDALLGAGADLRLPAAVALDRDVDRVLAPDRDALAPGGRWGTLILRASEQAPAHVVERLIHYGASVDVRDDATTSVDNTTGYTPLHAAAFFGNAGAARVLLEHKADLSARDTKYHGTPAGWADYAGHAVVRDLILAGPIDMFDAVRFDLTGRMREIFDRNPGALNERLRRFAIGEPSLADWPEQWRTPLAVAVFLGKAAAVRTLLDLGAEVGVREPNGRTLREIAAAAGHDEIARLLETYSVEQRGAGTDLVARFLAAACPDHHVRGKPSHVVALYTAERLLAKHPELVRENIYTAVVCGDIEYVDRLLAAQPELAREKGGPNGSAGGRGSTFTVQSRTASHPKWEPILYLCFTRLDIPASNDNAVAIATALLDHGADPNAYFMAGDSRYSPLTGVVGLGEEDRPPHPRRDELARLLLERGANPYDVQVFYDVHFNGDVLWYLKLIYERTHEIGRGDDWKDPQWSMIDMGGYGLGAHYLLRTAVSNNNLELAEWILAHGADANAPGPTGTRRGRRKELPTFHEMALREGYTEMADLLVRFGARPSRYVPEGEAQFVDAVLRLDRDTARRIAATHPEYLRSPAAMFAAAWRDNVEAVRLLIELGVSIEVEDRDKRRPLHEAASNDAVNVAKLLIERGAEIDPVETNWGNSPIGFARYFQLTRMIDLLAPHSRSLGALAFAGKVDRLRELLTADPSLAKWVSPEGITPIMRLPDDETKARQIVELFLANGADASVRNEEGLTAADIAEHRGMDEIAAVLRRPSS